MTQRQTNAEVIIRVATQADVEALAAMRRLLQHHSEQANAHLFTMSAARLHTLPEMYATLLRDPNVCVVVAEEEHHRQSIGMAMGRILRLDGLHPAEHGRIDDVWVDPAYRRRGVCRALVHALLVFFEHHQIDAISLEYVVGNHEAEATWVHYGLQPVLTMANGSRAALQRFLTRERSD